MSLFRSGRTASVQVRGFTSSSSLRVGPESPNFIDVPRTIQPELPSKRQVKGTLPVPREIFPARRADKPTEKYIAAATPLPRRKGEIDHTDPNAAYIASKRRMADMRRKNLREGLLELHGRKKQTDEEMKTRSRKKQARRDEILRQPEREDERLTRPSIVEEMMPKRMGVLPDPDREQRLQASQARLEAVDARKRLEREDALQALYMNARNFITSEEQLNAEIDRVFPEGENPAFRNDSRAGESVWNLGPPPTVQSIVNDAKKNESARWDLLQNRIKQLGEEVTGGKL